TDRAVNAGLLVPRSTSCGATGGEVTGTASEWFISGSPLVPQGMPIASSPRGLLGGLLSLVAAVATLSCASASPVVPADLLLPLGTYGGDSGGMIVGDT